MASEKALPLKLLFQNSHLLIVGEDPFLFMDINLPASDLEVPDHV